MNERENFVAYEYKNISVTRDNATMYIDSMKNFGWTLVEDDGINAQDIMSLLNPVNFGMNIANTAQTLTGASDGSGALTLKFKRDRKIENRQELDELERKFREVLSEAAKIERRSNGQAMSVTLGTGIIGAAFIGLAVYSFMSANIFLGILFATVGLIGWAVGAYFGLRSGSAKSEKIEPQIQEKLDKAYEACEQAHMLLA